MAGDHVVPTDLPPRLGFLIILPDAVRQGLVQAIGGYLGELGARVIAAVPETLTPRHITALYPNGHTAKTSPSGRVHGPEMTRRLLSLDNSLAVLVDRAEPGPDLSVVLHDSKGPSSYLQRRPGSLRDLSPLADRCMSLVHTPDDGREGARDTALFFPDLDVTGLTAERGGRRIDWQGVEVCRGWHQYGPGDSRYAIGVRTVLRCVATLLAWPPDPADTDFGPWWRMYDSCLDWLAREPLGPGAEHQRYLVLCTTLRHWLPGPGAVRFPPGRAAAGDLLALLTTPSSFDHHGGVKVLSLLRDARFALSDFESHHLLTLMTFFGD